VLQPLLAPFYCHARSLRLTPVPPPLPQVTLEPYERDHAVVVGVYRAQKKKEQ
jgi:hypothetical protein